MSRLVHVIAVLAIVAVPFVGWFVDGWSGGTTLVVYWFETLVVTLLIAARVLVHRRLAPCRGHYRYQAAGSTTQSPTRPSFLAGFLITSLAFTAAHGVFLVVIVFLLGRNGQRNLAGIDWHSVRFGCLLVLGFLCVDLAVDLVTVRRWPFRRLELMAKQGFSRIVVVHLTLILGLFAIAVTDAPNALFGVFVVLKSLAALSFALPQWEPQQPPAWFSRAMNRLPNVHPGQRFEEHWAKDRADELARLARNEEPWTPSTR
ncbi:hypothetical protein MPRF_42310 [Mycolicibacterium parafortuitum]|uniref:Uncharacterized protein n=1 Tax=Mycolicibacterium parafortuitum TaxID=39692 RepID=A0A7I7U7G5_MYCPF|nr:DUF6498-containing protein [Mycolicibacterium parafortuitum]BBY77332.1 hypothetical protein MPRF_42310 [Mycolicibacterium parafortuitum]